LLALGFALASGSCSSLRSKAGGPRAPRKPPILDSGGAPSRANGWDLLGEQTVTAGAGRAVIPVTRPGGRYREIRVHVEGGRIELYELVVAFGDGGRYSPGTKLLYRSGSGSRSLNLPGGDRAIRSVSFRYGSVPRGGAPRLRLYGR
jgi:hypothetical protein